MTGNACPVMPGRHGDGARRSGPRRLATPESCTDLREICRPCPNIDDTVVVKDGGSSTGVRPRASSPSSSSSPPGWYFLLGPGAGSTDAPTDINVNVELPSVAPDAS